VKPPIYVGDEVSGAGYRLTGAQVLVPAPGRASEALEEARARSPLVLVSAAVAEQIPESRLAAVVVATSPLTVVVPDPVSGVPAPDLAKRLRGQLGMEG
jgi:vacuolar-type H+-ATPase subunit F/Vma7